MLAGLTVHCWMLRTEMWRARTSVAALPSPMAASMLSEATLMYLGGRKLVPGSTDTSNRLFRSKYGAAALLLAPRLVTTTPCRFNLDLMELMVYPFTA